MTFEVVTLLTRKDPTMTTPKKYTSVTRIGVTAEFTAFPTSKGFVRLYCGECGHLTFYRSKR